MFKKVKEKMGNFSREMKSVFKSTQMRILKSTITENKNSIGGILTHMLYCQHVTG